MYATIQKWGNSQGLRIPKALLDAVGLKEHDRVELVRMDDVQAPPVGTKGTVKGTAPWRNASPHSTESPLTRSTELRPKSWIGGRRRALRHGDDF